MYNRKDFNIFDKVDDLGDGDNRITLSFVHTPDEKVLVRASKDYSLEKKNINSEWNIVFENISMSGADMQNFSFALIHLSDAMKDVDLNIKHIVETEEIKRSVVDNDGCYFPPNIEGYWRLKPIKDQSGLPFPKINTLSVKDYSQEDFISALEKVESKAQVLRFKGMSNCRLTGEWNGSTEYSYKNWNWPSGYINYIKKGVLPSREFFFFVTGQDNENLTSFQKP